MAEKDEALAEKLRQMTPEDLAAYQKSQCIFCHMVTGKIQTKKIYDDDICVAVLDINPANPGHLLLFPKEHYTISPQVPPSEVKALFTTAQRLMTAQLRALKANGVNVVVSNGVAAGQRAQHLLVHLIPRRDNDQVTFQVPMRTIPEAELEHLHTQLTPLVEKAMGKSLTREQQVKSSAGQVGKHDSHLLDDITRLLGK